MLLISANISILPNAIVWNVKTPNKVNLYFKVVKGSYVNSGLLKILTVLIIFQDW